MNTLENSLDHPPPSASPLGAVLSAFLPGLGQLLRGFPMHAGKIWITGGILGGLTWAIDAFAGPVAGGFFGMLIILPWWCVQAYEAYLPIPEGQFQALKISWTRAYDIRYLGGLFLLTAITDLYIILINPEYSLTILCSKPTGIPGILAKAQSPALHIAIGYGFLRLHRWAFFVYLAYAGFGLLNATANYACFGFGRIRAIFFISLLAFTAYVIWRRECFDESRNSCSP